MSTDLYGVRVLAIDPANRRVKLRVFVVYETRPGAFDHTALPGDRSFFLRVLSGVPAWKYRWMRAPIDAHIPPEQRYDEAWVNANAWRYIERFERVRTQNEPLLDPPDEGITVCHYERDGTWEQEPRLMQADFDVYVTRPEYLAHLELGMSWGTTAYGSGADELDADEAAVLPDFFQAKELFPFGPRGAVRSTALSHDGALFAAVNTSGHLVVYETERWSEVYRSAERRAFATIGFIAGHRSLLCLNRLVNVNKAKIIDVARGGREPPAPKHLLLDPNGRPACSASADGARAVVAGPHLLERSADGAIVREWTRPGWTHPTVISADGSTVAGVLRQGADREIALWNARTGDELARWSVERTPSSIALSPDGRFLACATNYGPAVVHRASDGTVVRQDKPQINAFVTESVHWDPRGRFVLSRLEPSSRSGPCHVLIAPIGASTRRPRGPRPIRIVPAPSKMNPSAIARARAEQPASSADDFARLVAGHQTFLAAGGRESTFAVRSKGGVPVAYFEEGDLEIDIEPLADLSLRTLPPSIAGVDLSCADLTAVDATGVDATRVTLVGASVTDSNFERACFRDANLSRANFRRSNLRGADLRGADLRKCNFERCDLTGADFTGAQIGGVKLKFATLDRVVGFGLDG